jgi:hypothetical protein
MTLGCLGNFINICGVSMIGWIYRTLIGSFHVCNHKWETILVTIMYDSDSNDNIGRKFTQQCEKCGNIKFFKNY